MIIGRKTVVPGADFSGIKINEAQYTLSSIAVTQPPTKTSYYKTDDFERAGMIITATFTLEGGSSFSREVEDYDYYPRSFDTAGEQAVTISYTYKGVTKTATQTVSVQDVTSYQISENLQNGSMSGDTVIVDGGTANVTIIPLEGAVLPQTKECITVTGATLDSYDATTGASVLSNPTDGVVVTARCPDEDTWLDTTAYGSKTYRQIFGDITASGPRLFFFDGMLNYGFEKVIPYNASGNTNSYTGLANADTLGRSLYIERDAANSSNTRACFTINKNPSTQEVWWSGTKFNAGDLLCICAKVKGGITAGTRPTEPSNYTKLGINQGSSGFKFGTCPIVELTDPAESEFSTWTTRVAIEAADKAMNAGYCYFGFPSLSSFSNLSVGYYVDDVFILNLTMLFGSGNEPSTEDMTSLYENFVTLWKQHNVYVPNP